MIKEYIIVSTSRRLRRLCFPPCPCVRASVRPSVLQVCYQLISGTAGPIAAKLSTHLPWMPIQNLCPTFLKWPSWWRYNRPMFAKHITVHYSYRFCPKIKQIGRQCLYSHVITTELSDCPYSILIGWYWLSKLVRLVHFGQNASNHKCSVQLTWNRAHTFPLGRGTNATSNFWHQPHGGAITGRFVVLPITPPISFKLCKRTPYRPRNLFFFTSAFYSATWRPTYVRHIFGYYSFRFYPKWTQLSTQYLHSHMIKMDLSCIKYSILIG